MHKKFSYLESQDICLCFRVKPEKKPKRKPKIKIKEKKAVKVSACYIIGLDNINFEFRFEKYKYFLTYQF